MNLRIRFARVQWSLLPAQQLDDDPEEAGPPWQAQILQDDPGLESEKCQVIGVAECEPATSTGNAQDDFLEKGVRTGRGQLRREL